MTMDTSRIISSMAAARPAVLGPAPHEDELVEIQPQLVFNDFLSHLLAASQHDKSWICVPNILTQLDRSFAYESKLHQQVNLLTLRDGAGDLLKALRYQMVFTEFCLQGFEEFVKRKVEIERRVEKVVNRSWKTLMPTFEVDGGIWERLDLVAVLAQVGRLARKEQETGRMFTKEDAEEGMSEAMKSAQAAEGTGGEKTADNDGFTKEQELVMYNLAMMNAVSSIREMARINHKFRLQTEASEEPVQASG